MPTSILNDFISGVDELVVMEEGELSPLLVHKALGEALEPYGAGRVFSDIGCYTLGALPPYNAINSCVDMAGDLPLRVSQPWWTQETGGHNYFLKVMPYC